MATKKGKHPTASRKQPAKSESTKRGKSRSAEPEVEEVVEVVEVEAPVLAMPEDKMTFTEKLGALNPARLVAELVGTFILTAVFIRLVSNTNYGLIAIALTTSALVMIGRVHLNPAITFAQWILRKIDGVKAMTFIVAQVLGAILAFFVLTGFNNASYNYKAAVKASALKSGATVKMMQDAGGFDKWIQSIGGLDLIAGRLGVTKEAPKLYQYSAGLVEGKEWVAMLSELTGAIVLGLGAGYAYDKKKKHQKVAKGLVIGLCWMAGMVIGSSTLIDTVLNPAVASTMGVFSWGSTNAFLWPVLVYVFGAIVGVTIGMLVYSLLSKRLESESAGCDC